MSYRALTFYLVSAALILGLFRLFERPRGDTGAAIAANLRARFLSEASFLIVSLALFVGWTWLIGESTYGVVGGLVLSHGVGVVVWWVVHSLTDPPPPGAPPPAAPIP